MTDQASQPDLQSKYDAELKQNAQLSKTLQDISDENQTLKKELARYYPNRDAKPLAILGDGPTKGEGLNIAQSLGCELWEVNCRVHAETTMLWQMHHESLLNSRRWTDNRGEKTSWWDFIQGKPPSLPVMMHRAYPEIPNSVAYPLRQVSQHFNSVSEKMYSANTISYMLAYALWRKCYNPIFLYGVDYHYLVHIEADHERPCTEFWMGWAFAWNVKLHLPTGTMLLTICDPQRKLYGFELNPALSLDEVETSLIPYDWGSTTKNGGTKDAVEHGTT